MDGKLWSEVYQLLLTIDYPNPTTNVTHDDRTIALVSLRATADDQPISWACRPENWSGLPAPPSWPSQPTMSRRLKTRAVQALLETVYAWLAGRETPDDRVTKLDGRPLLINPWSKDRDAGWGYALRGFGCGYKVHVAWGSGPVPQAWEVRPLNAAEPRVAAERLVPALPIAAGKRYLPGDSAYDSNPLHGVAAARGYQLLAPQKRPGKGWGHCRHHPARIRGLEQLQTPYGERLYRRRAEVERAFAHWAVRREGLDELPAHVRRAHRVTRFVHQKLILNGCRILYNKNNLRTKAA